MARPILDEFELDQVQRMVADGDRVLIEHGVPALEGDFHQQLGRRAGTIDLLGVLTGPESAEKLAELRRKFRAAQPVSFVADIATARQVDRVLIEEMRTRELAGRPRCFEYALRLREFQPAQEPPTEQPPVEPPPPPQVATLIVEVTVEGRPAFDFSRVTVTVSGERLDGSSFEQTLANRAGNVWTEEGFAPGDYTAEAVASEPEEMRGSAPAQVRSGETTRVAIVLSPGRAAAKAFIIHFTFDRAFVDPCMRPVLRRVAERARRNPEERIVIVGHTDKTGSDFYNQSLSERRARTVFAALTFGRDAASATAAVGEWDAIRRPRPAGQLPSVREGRGGWAAPEYQAILEDLLYYSGPLTGQHDSLTDAAVRAFQADHGLAVDGIVGDQTWPPLIEAYLAQDSLAVDEGRFLENCPGERLKWLGCGEEMPLPDTPPAPCAPDIAWRPNRRVEILFVRDEALPCEVPEPDTFNLPAPGSVAGGWCLGPGDPGDRCCFLTRDPDEEGKWRVLPAEPATLTVRGSIMRDDGTPLANADYVLIAPDGEFMDGEELCGDRRGRPVPGQTDASGAFEYPDKPKITGVYVLELEGDFIVRLAEEPPQAANGNVVCKRLEPGSSFDVIATPFPGDPVSAGPLGVGRHEYSEADEGSFDLPEPGALPDDADVFDPPPAGTSTFSVRRKALVRYPGVSDGDDVDVSPSQAQYPLALILHGNHRRKRPVGGGEVFVESFRGLEYLASHLASHGYIAVSIDADDINQRADAIFHRGVAILEHLQVMTGRNSNPPPAGKVDLRGRIDFSRIGLIGHSRGGEGVLAAERINQDKGLGHAIGAVASIAPTNFEDLVQATTPYLILYGSQDGDVDGSADSVNPFLIYDRAQPVLRTMIFIYGAIHNRFSTNPDWLDPTQIDRTFNGLPESDHINLAKGYCLAFLELHFRRQLAFEALFRRYGKPPSVGHVELHHQFQEPGRSIVDDYDQLPRDATENSLGQTVAQSGLAVPDGAAEALAEISLQQGDTDFFVDDTFGGMVAWDALGGRYTTGLGGFDASPSTVLAFRVAQRFDNARNPAGAVKDFQVRLTDASGEEAEVRVGAVTSIPFPDRRDDVLALTKSALKSVRVPLSRFTDANSRLNLAALDSISFLFEENPTGEIAVDDIEFSD